VPRRRRYRAAGSWAAGCHDGSDTHHDDVGATEPAATATLGREGTRPAAAFLQYVPPLQVLAYSSADGCGTRPPIIHDKKTTPTSEHMDGPPLAAAGNGLHHSKLAPDGKRVLPRWIESGRRCRTQRAEGMQSDDDCSSGLDTVRSFHRITGAPRGEETPGTKFLHSVSRAPDHAGSRLSKLASGRKGPHRRWGGANPPTPLRHLRGPEDTRSLPRRQPAARARPVLLKTTPNSMDDRGPKRRASFFASTTRENRRVRSSYVGLEGSSRVGSRICSSRVRERESFVQPSGPVESRSVT